MENEKITHTNRPVKNLLVDLDGTLLGNKNITLSYDFVKQALSKLKVYGGIANGAKLLYSIGKELNKTSKDLTNDLRIVQLASQQLNLSLEDARKVVREGVSTIFPTLERHFFPIQGAKEFLDWAKDHYPLTLATNPVWPPEIIELRVKWAGLDPSIFSEITHVRKMHSYKPSPQYYEEILAQQGLKAEDCLLIGDNMKMDLPATRVGIRVFIVGQFKTVSPIRTTKSRAQAWKGNYKALRQLLTELPQKH